MMEALYRDVINEAIRLNVGTLAMPAIGTGNFDCNLEYFVVLGAFGYPLDAAAEHARDAIRNCVNFGNLKVIS